MERDAEITLLRKYWHQEIEKVTQLQALVRVFFTEPDPHKWTAAYQTLKRMGRTLPATTPAPMDAAETHDRMFNHMDRHPEAL